MTAAHISCSPSSHFYYFLIAHGTVLLTRNYPQVRVALLVNLAEVFGNLERTYFKMVVSKSEKYVSLSMIRISEQIQKLNCIIVMFVGISLQCEIIDLRTDENCGYSTKLPVSCNVSGH